MEQINSLKPENKPEVRIMLEKLYDLFRKKFKDSHKAWDYFIEFLAVDNSGEMIFQIEHKFEWLINDKRFRDSVSSIYDSLLLKSDYYDHLGDIYFGKKISNIKKESTNLLPAGEIQSLIKKGSSEKESFIKLLDPNTGTGRNLMTAHKIDPEALLFGVEDDLQVLRIALTNFAIFGIKCFLLHANSQIHEIKLNNKNGINNWKYANQWNSHINKLRQNLDKSFT